MKKLIFLFFFCCLLSFTLFSAPVYDVFGISCHEGVLFVDRVGRLSFDSSFSSGLSRWVTPLVNYQNKLTFSCIEYDGRPVFHVELQGEKCDTAWEMSSQPFAVSGESDYVFTIHARSSLSFERPQGHKGSYNTMLQWLDANGEPLKESKPFGFATFPNKWQETTIVGRTPAEATSAVIKIGGDRPNFDPEDFLAISRCQFVLKPHDAPCHEQGTCISSPIPVTGNSATIAWDATCPPGTAITMQIATAADHGGKPGDWTDFVGPDNSAQSFFDQSRGQQITGIPQGHKWIRYKATLFSRQAVSPALRSVTVAGVKDVDFVVGDSEPPVLTMVSLSPVEDTMAPIQFRLDDKSPIVKPSVKFFLDDVDLTARLSFANGVFTYWPAMPIQPVGFSSNPRRWESSNYRGALTFIEVPGELNALRVTREKKRVDTSFKLMSRPLPVRPEEKYLLKFTVRHDVSLLGHQGKHNSIVWRDADKNAIGAPVLIEMGAECLTWKSCQQAVDSPPRAASAVITFGFDVPDLFDGRYFDLKDATLEGPSEAENLAEMINIHTVRIMAEDMNGNLLDEERTILFDRPATENIVTMRDDGFVLIDGKPFFLIGLYAVWKKDFNNNSFDVAFRGLKEAGFNFAHTYNNTRNQDFTDFLDAADKHGIKLWLSKSDLDNFMREKRRPSMLAWYLGDDTSSHIPAAIVRQNHLLCYALDNAHLTTQADAVGGNIAGQSNYSAYVHSTDSFLPEIYPMSAAKPSSTEVPQVISDMKTIYEDLRLAGNPVKSIWAIIQHFEGWGWKRFPTYAEQRAMTYLAIIHGAHGVTWYTYGGTGDNHGVTHTPEHWRLICSIAGELAQLQNQLTARNAAQQPMPVIMNGPEKDGMGFPAVSCLLKDNSGKKILLAANSATEAVKAKIPLQGMRAAEVIFENRRLEVNEGAIVDDFAPFAVHVYQLE